MDWQIVMAALFLLVGICGIGTFYEVGYPREPLVALYSLVTIAAVLYLAYRFSVWLYLLPR